MIRRFMKLDWRHGDSIPLCQLAVEWPASRNFPDQEVSEVKDLVMVGVSQGSDSDETVTFWQLFVDYRVPVIPGKVPGINDTTFVVLV